MSPNQLNAYRFGPQAVRQPHEISLRDSLEGGFRAEADVRLREATRRAPHGWNGADLLVDALNMAIARQRQIPG
jgi:hypothetical protein